MGAYRTYADDHEVAGLWDNGIYTQNPQIESSINNLDNAINAQIALRKVVKHEGKDKVVYLGNLVNGNIPDNQLGILIYANDVNVSRAFEGIVDSQGKPNFSIHGLLYFIIITIRHTKLR